MYLISVYFDEKTNRRIQQYIDQIAKKSGNTFMIDRKIPPHITISAFDTKCEVEVLQVMEKQFSKLKTGSVTWASVGVFLPYVMYLAPVLNEYLYTLATDIYESLYTLESVKISSFYRPLQWIPHTTIGKTLSKEEMMMAFQVMQGQFGVFCGQVTKIGIARTNPYENLCCVELQLDGKDCF